jgi:hypothetical protein
MKRLLAATVLGLLATPAVASAHPGVYTVTQLTRAAGQICTIDTQPDPTVCLTQTKQYAVANDGWARSFTESNGLDTAANRGLINYKVLPGGTNGWRGGAENREQWRTYAAAQTGLQAHAVCLGLPGLETGDVIRSWQEDPFYNYVPWQAASAGLGDEPSMWIPVVKNLTGVDLAALTETQAASECARLSGTYYAPDTGANITSALETSIKTPLQSQITKLNADLRSEQAKSTAAEAARQALVARPLALTLSGRRTAGISMVTGAAGTAVKVRMLISAADAKKLKIARTLATKTRTLGGQGATLFSLTPSKTARKAITRRVRVTVEAVGGGVTRTASGVYVS